MAHFYKFAHYKTENWVLGKLHFYLKHWKQKQDQQQPVKLSIPHHFQVQVSVSE